MHSSLSVQLILIVVLKVLEHERDYSLELLHCNVTFYIALELDINENSAEWGEAIKF